jgi:hypothetical protein
LDDLTAVYAVPGWLGLALITLLCVGLACGGHVIVHRTFRSVDFIEHNEVAGFIVAVVGVLYAVLLGFLTVVVWEHYAESDERAQSEVDAATDIWRFARLLPAPQADRIRGDIERYAVAVAGDEWPKMRRGESSAQVQALIIHLIADIAAIPLPDARASNLQSHLLDRVQVMADLRRHRINDNRSTVLPVIKLALIVGACTVLGFLYLFGLENFRVQLLMTAATATIIGILLALIVLLDYPFRGDVSVSPERWLELHATMVQEAGLHSTTSTGATPRGKVPGSAGRLGQIIKATPNSTTALAAPWTVVSRSPNRT